MRVTLQNQISSKTQLADFVTSLEVGDSVRGRIIELLGESILLKTASGQMLTAALLNNAELKPGQNIELLISSITEDGIFAELKPELKKQEKLTEDVKLQQVLKQLSIKPEEGNMQAAKLLLKYNMPITKDNILNLVNTQKSIEAMAQGDAVKALSLMQSELDIINTEFTKLAKQAVLLEEQGKQALNFVKNSMLKIPMDENSRLPEKAALTETHQEAAPMAKAQNGTAQASLSRQTASKNPAKQPPIEDTAKQAMKQAAELINKEEVQGSNSGGKLSRLIDTIVKTFETASMAKPEHSAYLFSKEVEITPAAVKSLMLNAGSKDKLGEQLQRLEGYAELLEQNGADTKEIKQELKKTFLTPEALQDKEQLQESIKEAAKLAGKLESLLREYGLEDKVDKTIFTDIKSNLDFQKNIGTAVNYIQLPMVINESKTTAELYVFSRNNRNKAINPENASILIALDLKVLGHIESFISLHMKSVTVTFKVEKDEFKQLILGSGGVLKQSLEARGYTLNPIQVIDMTERFGLLELEELNVKVPNNMHLDIKV